jgi:NTR2-like protein
MHFKFLKQHDTFPSDEYDIFKMKKSFSARRVPRKFGADEEEDEPGSGHKGKNLHRAQYHFFVDSGSRSANITITEPVVKRPALQAKTKRKSAARLSFGPGETNSESSAQEDQEPVLPPKKSGLSRLAIERNAARHATTNVPFRTGIDLDRPSYSKDSLRALQQSTPTTPQDSGSSAAEADELDALDIKSKFGSLAKLSDIGGPAIPTEAEIREKKERRARLAKEQEYISLYGDESEDENRHRDIILKTEEKYPETRLIHEDEDIAEGFDEFVEDERISLGKKSRKEQERKRRQEMASLIDEAQGALDEDENDDSELERNEAYDAAQTKAGTYGQKKENDLRPRTPPRIAPIPDLQTILSQLHDALNTMRETKDAKQRRILEIAEEKKQLVEQEAYIQSQLKETGEKYEKLRAEAGLNGTSGTLENMKQDGKVVVHRGLDTLGSTPGPEDSSDDDDYY